MRPESDGSLCVVEIAYGIWDGTWIYDIAGSKLRLIRLKTNKDI